MKDGELHAVSMEVEAGPVVQLTFGAVKEGKTNGLADFIAQEVGKWIFGWVVIVVVVVVVIMPKLPLCDSILWWWSILNF